MAWVLSRAAVAAVTIVALGGFAAPGDAQEGPAAAPKPTAEERLERLERELEKTRAELDAVKKEQAEAARKAAEKPAAEPAPGEAKKEGGTEGAGGASPDDEKREKARTKLFGLPADVRFKDGFEFVFYDPDWEPSADGKDKATDAALHRIGLHGRLHVDYRGFFEHDYPTDEQFLVRRARIQLLGYLFRYHEFNVEFDLGNFGSTLRDGYIDFHYVDELRLRVGQMKVPFSREQFISSRYLPFVERSFFNLATAGIQFDVGAELHGELGPVQYYVGVFNGRGSGARDDNSEKDLAGRFVVNAVKPTKESFLGVSVGVSGTLGHQSTIPSDFNTYAGTT